jgi:hypothetical protein
LTRRGKQIIKKILKVSLHLCFGTGRCGTIFLDKLADSEQAFAFPAQASADRFEAWPASFLR